MKLFKEKKPREIKEDDSLFIKLWYNKRTHAMMVLGLYAIFFIIIILLANISTNKSKKTSDELIKELKPYFDNMDQKDISYNLVINSNDDIYYFQGAKNENDIYGNLLHNSETNMLKLNDEGCKVGSFMEEYFIENENLSCPEVINYELFDYLKIFDEISTHSSTIKKLNEYYLYKGNDIEYRIYVKGELLSRIDIINNDTTYSLNYFVNALENDNLEGNIDNNQ